MRLVTTYAVGRLAFGAVALLAPATTGRMLAGDGGTGKSILALQLAVAVATGTEWIGLRPMEGVVLYVSAEDDVDEVAPVEASVRSK